MCVYVTERVCVCVCDLFSLTGYFSRGSVSNASPNIDRQYSAIFACCLGLKHSKSVRHAEE